jgi:hypothetical protein
MSRGHNDRNHLVILKKIGFEGVANAASKTFWFGLNINPRLKV